MRRVVRIVLYVVVSTGWAGAVGVGAVRLWHYESAAGEAAKAPSRWPAGTGVARNPKLANLVLALHPKCPCSRATVEELSRLMSDCRGKVAATVLVLRPAGEAPGWERTGLWADAGAIPGVKLIVDDEGVECRRFGAATSGQTFLYGADGRLLFSGGITESRGHSGDNAGRSAITELVMGTAAEGAKVVGTPVYGCPLFDGPGSCPIEGSATCPK